MLVEPSELRRLEKLAARAEASEAGLPLLPPADAEGNRPAVAFARASIARSIVNRPTLLLADEPTGNLDTATSEEVMGIVQRLNDERGITIVLVTHENDISGFARRVVTVRDGKIISDHPVEKRRVANVRGDVA